ncbi:hypothetical protein M3O75_12605 [Klebsiella pneumoniae]|nr:hypothetical protein [Klebsiella pneumoniae]
MRGEDVIVSPSWRRSVETPHVRGEDRLLGGVTAAAGNTPRAWEDIQLKTASIAAVETPHVRGEDSPSKCCAIGMIETPHVRGEDTNIL